MRKYITGLCALLLILGSVRVAAQTEEPRDIVVTNFENVVTDLTASVTPVNDNNGVVCAVIKFFVRDTTFVIEPNLGYLKRESKMGEIRLWVPAGTKRLTVRHEGMFPLKDYIIPMTIESKRAYHAYLWSPVTSRTSGDTDKPKTKVPKEPDSSKKRQEVEIYPVAPLEEPVPDSDRPSNRKTRSRLFLDAGYLFTPVQGIRFGLGLNANHHIIEVGATLALGKTDSLHYYNNSVWQAAYTYQLLRTQFEYGYEYRTRGRVSFGYTPSMGVNSTMAFGSGSNNERTEYGRKQVFKDGMALSVSAAARVALCVGNHFAWYVKPKYSIAVYKSDSYKLMIKGNDVFKKWAEGFALETGFVVSF